MFCTVCGKSLPEEYRYIVCDPCFDKKRKEILSNASKESALPRAFISTSGVLGPLGFSGFSGFSGYNLYEPPVIPREEQPPVAYYIYSERADKIEKDIEKKRRSRKKLKRLIRFTGEEGEDTEEGYSTKRMIRIEGEDAERCPTEEDIINFKKSFTAQIELINKNIIVNPEEPTEGERDLFQHIKVCEKCKKLWDSTH
jgi:hypothetical protein